MRAARWAQLAPTIVLKAAGQGALVSCAQAGASVSPSHSRATQHASIGDTRSWIPYNFVNGLAAASPSAVWAAGSAATGQTLVEHWNGQAWKRAASPSPGGSHGSVLNAVAASGSAGSWAVGYYGTGTAVETLIERWNGRAWKQVASPSPGGSHGSSTLAGVAATGPANAWAVGSYERGNTMAWQLKGRRPVRGQWGITAAARHTKP
ncbi:MAG TPA: hypothetical protein VMU94_16570 [Streptosporangiaceae bacterium]|nr:hypothetical protein [Streptosporangiaceae bacterium]